MLAGVIDLKIYILRYHVVCGGLIDLVLVYLSTSVQCCGVVERANGSFRSQDAVPFSHTKTQCVCLTILSLTDLLNHAHHSSQQSIQKVVGFALKFFSQCGEDLWDCIVEECQKVTTSISFAEAERSPSIGLH